MRLPRSLSHLIERALDIVVQMGESIKVLIIACRQHATITDVRGRLIHNGAVNQRGGLLHGGQLGREAL